MVDEAGPDRKRAPCGRRLFPMGHDSGVHTAVHTYDDSHFDLPALVAAKQGRRVTVCLPARNEEATVGSIVAMVRAALTLEGEGADLVDEIIVVDDGSTDTTATVAARAGALVVPAGTLGGGKGQAMAVGLAESSGDLLVFLDADVENFTPHFVTGLLGPLLLDESLALVKGFYTRPLHGQIGEGGRVTELMARPLLDVLFPALAGVHQPLAGETAAPRAVLEKTGLANGYGIEIALLVDVADQFGPEAIAQVDLGVRVHRNRPLADLRHQATEVLRAALERAGTNLPD